MSSFSFFWEWFWYLLKYLYHLYTGKCELERICERKNHDLKMTRDFAHSVLNSKKLAPLLIDSSRFINPALSKNEIYAIILKHKNINTEKPHVVDNIKKCITGMLHVRDSFNAVDALKSTPYNSLESSHEELLEELWKNLVKEVHDERDWSSIGFQRKDEPRTDFRGMGILGLSNLVYVSKLPAFRLILKESHKLNYSFAITGINLTADLYNYLKSYEARFRFMDVNKEGIHQFSELYAEVFIRFHEYWRERKPNIMEFNQIRNEFWIKMKESNIWLVPQRS